MNALLLILIALILPAGLGLLSQAKSVNLFLTKVREFIASRNRHWWIKITTDAPLCTYYFGPFETIQEAKDSQSGYWEDLQQEGALGIASEIQRIKPQELTLEEAY